MTKSIEEKWRALPPEKELEIRREVLAEEQRGLAESQAAFKAAEPGTREERVAIKNTKHFLGRIKETEERIIFLRELINRA